MNIWHAVPIAGQFWVTLSDEHGVVIKTHPLPFTDKREADRAAARLNVRDDEIRARWNQVPHAHADEH